MTPDEFWAHAERQAAKVKKWPLKKRREAAAFMQCPCNHSNRVACHPDYGCDKVAERNKRMHRHFCPEDFE